MSTATVPLPASTAYSVKELYRFSVDQWHAMIDGGLLTADDPVELIEGVAFFKMPKNPPHETTIGLVTDELTTLLPANWHLRGQASVTLADGEPEPDGAVVRGRRIDYARRHPGPSDIGLLIEVSDSTLDRDHGVKLRSYARAGIGCYWIVNLVDRQIEVYADPDSAAETPRFRRAQLFKAGDAVPVMLDGQMVGQVQVADVLPPVE